MKGKKSPRPPLDDDDVVDLPSAVDRLPEPPESLKGRAKELWALVVGDLVVRSVYGDDSRNAAMAYCIQLARFLDAEDDINERGALVKMGENLMVLNQSLKISDAACDRLHRLGLSLGLAPTARKRVTKVRGAGLKAPAQRFLKRA
jgi:P27 family predicted phage terminase small subunit